MAAIKPTRHVPCECVECVGLAEEVESLRKQVVYLRWTAEQAADDIERGREFDAIHGLRTALAGNSDD